MTTTFQFRFVDAKPLVLLELTNTTELTLRSIEILTIFLKDKVSSGQIPAKVHISFDSVKMVKPNEKAVLSHKTWINGEMANPEQDQLGRLKVVAGEPKPYVLDISWEDPEGKAQFQRISVGHLT